MVVAGTDNARLRAAWVALLGLVSRDGVFADFRSLPPRILPALLVPLLAGLVLFRSAGARKLLAHTPPQWPIYLQSFRILMELILWLLHLQHRAPGTPPISTLRSVGEGQRGIAAR